MTYDIKMKHKQQKSSEPAADATSAARTTLDTITNNNDNNDDDDELIDDDDYDASEEYNEFEFDDNEEEIIEFEPETDDEEILIEEDEDEEEQEGEEEEREEEIEEGDEEEGEEEESEEEDDEDEEEEEEGEGEGEEAIEDEEAIAEEESIEEDEAIEEEEAVEEEEEEEAIEEEDIAVHKMPKIIEDPDAEAKAYEEYEKEQEALHGSSHTGNAAKTIDETATKTATTTTTTTFPDDKVPQSPFDDNLNNVNIVTNDDTKTIVAGDDDDAKSKNSTPTGQFSTVLHTTVPLKKDVEEDDEEIESVWPFDEPGPVKPIKRTDPDVELGVKQERTEAPPPVELGVKHERTEAPPPVELGVKQERMEAPPPPPPPVVPDPISTTKIHDKKAKVKSNLWLWVIGVFIVGVAAGSLIASLRSKNDNKNNNIPTPPAPVAPVPTPLGPTPPASGGGDTYNVICSLMTNCNLLLNTSTPQGQAFAWLDNTTSNPDLETLSRERKIQRFALATFYYSTDGQNWVNNTSWLSPINECDWYTSSTSSICTSDNFSNINALILDNNQVQGSLPVEISLLSTLAIISLRFDRNTSDIISQLTPGVAGTLPTEMGMLTNIQSVTLSGNNITGDIPTEIGNWIQVTFLDMSSNQFTGPIPSQIGQLLNLKTINLSNNNLSGTLPSEISLLNALNEIYVDNNNLIGPVPDQICTLFNRTEPLSYGDCDELGPTASCFIYCCTNDLSCKCRFEQTDPLLCIRQYI